ncbi:MAG: magnesium transporter, partial [Gammaproteobacteria bacterium]|nr:magnesium transporter [Gammaproteobacteria bacterium]
MNESLEKSYQRQRETIHELLETGRFNQIRSLLNVLRPADVAVLLESSPPKERRIVWNLFSESDQSEILHEIDEGFIEGLLADKSAEELFPVIDQIVSDDDLIDVLQHLPDTITFQLLQSMTTQDRARVETLLSYPEDTAGGLMDTDTISVRPRVSVDVVLRYLRRHETLPATTDKIFVVNSQNKYLGLVHLSKLVVSDPSRTVREIMTTDFDPISAETPETEVASKFERYDLISAPVIDKDGSLIGRITIDDVVDVIMEQADKSLLGLAGLAEDEDTFAPIFKPVRSRAIWLGANLGTAFLASAVINIFEDTIEKVVALAIL